MTNLARACATWQSGRDIGSSPIRASARVLTDTPHYFEAPFIDDYESAVAANCEMLGHARTLLTALADSCKRNSSSWAAELGVASDWVGRGIKTGLQDDQIVATLAEGELSMPLWGASLDKEVAEGFGSRFIFELLGPFPAIPAWAHSGIKAEEHELIVGGRYSITDRVEEGPKCTRVLLRFTEVIPAKDMPTTEGRN